MGPTKIGHSFIKYRIDTSKLTYTYCHSGNTNTEINFSDGLYSRVPNTTVGNPAVKSSEYNSRKSLYLW